MKPGAFELFCKYHLGLSSGFRPKHHNLHSLARDYAVSSEEVTAWLEHYRMDPKTCSHVNYSIPKAAGDVLILALGASAAEVEEMARDSYHKYIKALESYDPTQVFEGTDWDCIWGDENSGNGT